MKEKTMYDLLYWGMFASVLVGVSLGVFLGVGVDHTQDSYVLCQCKIQNWTGIYKGVGAYWGANCSALAEKVDTSHNYCADLSLE